MLGGILSQEKVKIKKYLMGFDLLKIYEINHSKNIKLSLKHLTLLKWFIDFQGSNEMICKIFDNKVWYWCSYQKIISDLPILEVTNKEVLSRLIRDLVKAEILESYVDRKDNSKTYIRLGIMYTELISSEQNQNSFDMSTYTHKKRKIRLNSSRLKSRQPDDLKVGGLPTKKSNNRLVNYRLVSNRIVKIKTTTKHKSTFKLFKLSDIKKLEKSSSSSCGEIKKIEQLLFEKSLNNSTCKNILNAVKKHSLTLEKIKETFEYAKVNGKQIGYIVKALQENWDIPTPTPKKKSDSIEKENKFIKKWEVEKEQISNQTLPDIELTPELEQILRERLIAATGTKIDVLEKMKKTKKIYINALKQYL